MKAPRRGPRIPETHRYRVLLGCLLAIVLGYPFMDSTRTASGEFNLLLVLTCASALWAIAGQRRMAQVGIALTVVAFLGTVLQPVEVLWVRHLALACEAALFFLVAWAIGANVLVHENVTEDTLSGAACVYLVLGLGWTALYLIVTELEPGSFRFAVEHEASAILWPDLLYFSFTTLTSTGYGDISPIGDHARSLALIEQMVGVLYIAIVVARLVSVYRIRAAGPS